MLHRLWDHISNCYARAADARWRAGQTTDSARRSELLLLEEHWRRLAQSYEISEKLECYLSAHSQELYRRMDWQRAAVAPFDRVLELAVISAAGIDTVDIPCRRVLKGWIAAGSGEPVDVLPTHWREWSSDAGPETIKALERREPAVRSAAQLSLLPRQSSE